MTSEKGDVEDVAERSRRWWRLEWERENEASLDTSKIKAEEKSQKKKKKVKMQQHSNLNVLKLINYY